MRDSKWFAERFLSLRVPFPEQLDTALLWDAQYERFFHGDRQGLARALQKAYAFLFGIGKTLNKSQDTETVEKMLEKLNFIWTVFALSELETANGKFVLTFDKKKLNRIRNLTNAPSDYLYSFNFLEKYGFHTVFYKNAAPLEKPSYTFCDGGKIYFKDSLGAGLFLFVKRCFSFPFYHGAAKKTDSEKLCQYVSPFYRCDFRVFTVAQGVPLRFGECLSGFCLKYLEWGQKLERLPVTAENRFYSYICSRSDFYLHKNKPVFTVEINPYRQLFFRASLNKRELCRVYRAIDDFPPFFAEKFLHPLDCACTDCRNVKNHIVYKGKYYNAPVEKTTLAFALENSILLSVAYRIVEIKLQ